MSLEGQVAIVTGASSGIGRAVATELAGAGMGVLITGRRRDRLDELAATLPRAVVVPGDIMEPELAGRLVEASLVELGRLDVVVNNAGIMDVGPVLDADVERLCRNVRVNFEAAVRMAYAALRHFLKVGHGHLINTSSLLGMKVRPTAGVYAGTKHAIEALTDALRMEVAGTGVRVGCIAPGLVDTELQDHFAVHPRHALGIRSPLAGPDVARCVRFMLEQPPHVTVARMLVVPSEQPM